MRWCVALFFSRSCFFYKQKIIYHMTTNKIGQQPILPATPVMCSQHFECQSINTLLLLDIPSIDLTLLLWIREAAERKQGYQSSGRVKQQNMSICAPSYLTAHHIMCPDGLVVDSWFSIWSSKQQFNLLLMFCIFLSSLICWSSFVI